MGSCDGIRSQYNVSIYICIYICSTYICPRGLGYPGINKGIGGLASSPVLENSPRSDPTVSGWLVALPPK